MKRNINIINITPRGYCNGVVKAIKMINNVLNDNNFKKPLYIYGQLVHNKHVTNAFKNKGIITIDDYKNINEGTIIITAHGLSTIEKQYIINKGISIIDTTCKEVSKIQSIVKNKGKEGYTIIYYGKSNHPEANAIMNDNDNIYLVNNVNEVNDLIIEKTKPIFFTNQTTMSYFDTVNVLNCVKNKFNNVDANIDICDASRRRQIAVRNYAKKCDIVLVIGDKKSNNTNKLKDICDSLNVKSYLIENIGDLNMIPLYDNITIGITAGSSTPNKLINEVIKTLEDDEYISLITDDDYINI